MTVEIKVPAVGESINEVVVGSWTKSDGHHVEVDEVICELESDKANFEVTAELAGTIKIVAQEGDTLEIGALLCTIDSDGQATTDAPPSEAPSQPATAEAQKPTGKVIDMVVPTVGESIAEVSIASYLKEDGEFVELDEVIAEIESDKATFDLPAEASGILEIVAKEGDTLEIGALICRIKVAEGGLANGSAANAESKPVPPPPPPPTGDSYAAGHASPAAAKILAEKGIDTQQISGTGVGGRITKTDATTAQVKPQAQKTPPPIPQVADKSAAPPVPAGERTTQREKMTTLRKTIARRLVAVKNETAMLTTFNEVDMKPIMDIRGKYKEQFKEKYEIGLGFMSFFTKAVCVALQEWPAVNAIIDGNEILYHNYCDVSIAVSTPRGLVVPVIRNAEQLSFDGIEKEIKRLAIKARDGKLSIDEMTGGTFTITNGGVFGSMLSTPIINAPQSAILGMHNIVQRPVAFNGQVEVRPVMYVALSYDHRIIDGRESVSFLVRVKELLEDPTRLLLGV